MAWYFIAGFISGAVGMLLFLGWFGRRIEAAKNENRTD